MAISYRRKGVAIDIHRGGVLTGPHGCHVVPYKVVGQNYCLSLARILCVEWVLAYELGQEAAESTLNVVKFCTDKYGTITAKLMDAEIVRFGKETSISRYGNRGWAFGFSASVGPNVGMPEAILVPEEPSLDIDTSHLETIDGDPNRRA